MASSTTTNDGKIQRLYNDQLNSSVENINTSISSVIRALKLQLKPDTTNGPFQDFNITLHATNIIVSSEKLLSLVQTLQQSVVLTDESKINENADKTSEKHRNNCVSTQDTIDECCAEMGELLEELEKEYYTS